MIILYQKSTSTVQTTEFTFTLSLILRGLNHQGKLVKGMFFFGLFISLSQ